MLQAFSTIMLHTCRGLCAPASLQLLCTSSAGFLPGFLLLVLAARGPAAYILMTMNPVSLAPQCLLNCCLCLCTGPDWHPITPTCDAQVAGIQRLIHDLQQQQQHKPAHALSCTIANRIIGMCTALEKPSLAGILAASVASGAPCRWPRSWLLAGRQLATELGASIVHKL